jgi:hypothetical protein
MRKAFMLLAVLGVTSSLWAADPIIGTWKLNVEKSNYSPILEEMRNMSPANELTSVCRENDEAQIECIDTGVRVDGSLISRKILWPVQGGVATGSWAEGMSYIETYIEPGIWYVTVMRNSIQVSLMKKEISKDGKTMLITITGTDPQGRSFEQKEVFDRQ